MIPPFTCDGSGAERQLSCLPGVPAGAGGQAPGKKPPGAWRGIHASPALPATGASDHLPGSLCQKLHD